MLTVYLGNAADVANNFNAWLVNDCAGKGTYAHENGNYNFQITLSVSGGRATVSIDGTTVLADIEVGEVSGYVSLVNGLASGSYYDNLQIEEIENIEHLAIDGDIASLTLRDVNNVSQVGYKVIVRKDSEEQTTDFSKNMLMLMLKG